MTKHTQTEFDQQLFHFFWVTWLFAIKNMRAWCPHVMSCHVMFGCEVDLSSAPSCGGALKASGFPMELPWNSHETSEAWAPQQEILCGRISLQVRLFFFWPTCCHRQCWSVWFFQHLTLPSWLLYWLYWLWSKQSETYGAGREQAEDGCIWLLQNWSITSYHHDITIETYCFLVSIIFWAKP